MPSPLASYHRNTQSLSPITILTIAWCETISTHFIPRQLKRVPPARLALGRRCSCQYLSKARSLPKARRTPTSPWSRLLCEIRFKHTFGVFAHSGALQKRIAWELAIFSENRSNLPCWTRLQAYLATRAAFPWTPVLLPVTTRPRQLSGILI